ncbi:MAG TPA: cupredoxin domain-containing protein [bacterium]|nr:cupredoxin domain-containing protein [bacterium]
MSIGVAQSGYAAGAPATVQIGAKEFAFTPKTVTVGSGVARFVITNGGTVEHDFVIDALKTKSPLIKPGQTVTVLVTLKPGTYQVYCDVPGHKELGMVLSIVVK